ncbi:MAG: DUF1559 domain-containing protein, partial [Planctomycetaceae bacterium]|nr:DUF1559 domain-containing protein [Planctomycetaceae bacterium]
SATPAASTALQIGSGANFSLGVVGTDATANCKINARLNAVTAGTAPRPSSLHNNVVNAIMADGSGKSISQSIDDSVYARMISSNGNQKGQPILSDTEF